MSSETWAVRRGLEQDINAVLALGRTLDEAPHWPRTSYQQIFSEPGTETAVTRRLFVAVSSDGTILGFSVGALTRINVEGRGELESIGVAHCARRQGVGRALCLEVIAWCRAAGVRGVALEVRSGSSAPIALYLSVGFKDAGRRPCYYSDPPDAALVMQLTF